MDKATREQLDLIREHMCDDLDSEACKELLKTLRNKDVKIYFDTVKKSVVLCRECDCPEDLPGDIKFRLFQSLGLEDYIDQSTDIKNFQKGTR